MTKVQLYNFTSVQLLFVLNCLGKSMQKLLTVTGKSRSFKTPRATKVKNTKSFKLCDYSCCLKEWECAKIILLSTDSF